MFYFMGQMRPKTKGAYPGPGMNEMVYNLVYSGTFLCLPIKIIYIRGRVEAECISLKVPLIKRSVAR